MAILVAVFFLVALVCFILQTFNIPSPPPINVLALGLFFLTLAFFFGCYLKTPVRTLIDFTVHAFVS